MSLDLVLRHCRIAGREEASVDIGVKDGLIAAIETQLPDCSSRARMSAAGWYCPDLSRRIFTSINPAFSIAAGPRADRSITPLPRSRRPSATLREEDVYARAQRTLEKAILQGTTRMRTHVEIDPRIGLRSFNAIKKLKDDYAWAIDLEICVFPQEGLTNDPGADELLVEACRNGADLIGGCPYTDTKPSDQIARIFAIAKEFDLDIDFHLDFDLDPSWMHLHEVCRQTLAHGWGGRVAIGHVTKLSALPPHDLDTAAALLSGSGIALTILPATDLYLMGRDHKYNVPRGVTPAHRLLHHGVVCSIATNNVLNPFTPFGDCSLLRMANLYANVAQAEPSEFSDCFDMVTTGPARLMNLTDYGIQVGHPADIVVLDGDNRASVLAELAQPLFGLKRGQRTFTRPEPTLHKPGCGCGAKS